MPPRETVPTTADGRPIITAYTEYEQYEWLKANLFDLGMSPLEFRRWRNPSWRDALRAWISEHVVFVSDNGHPTIVRPGVVRMLQHSPDLEKLMNAAARKPPVLPPVAAPWGTR